VRCADSTEAKNEKDIVIELVRYFKELYIARAMEPAEIAALQGYLNGFIVPEEKTIP
jgi:hypothetical protein